MTIDHIEVEQLSALADGELAGAELARAEQHLSACASCRDTLQRVRALVRRAATLPPDVAPPDAVWAGIRRGIHRERRSRSWTRMAGVAGFAVAAGLVALAATATLRPGRSDKVRHVQPAVVTPVAFGPVAESYRASLEELRFTLEQQRALLAPGTVQVLERSIAVIDSAIAEASAALAADPGNQLLTDILSAQYEHKVNLLQRATKLSPAT